MASKGARCIELPIYVLNIGLLYALLLTSGLVLAWVTIYRHEQSIAELREMLNTRDFEDKRQSQAADNAVYEPEMPVQEDNSEEMNDNSPRVRRGKNGKMGMKGDRGEKGDVGRDGGYGPIGLPGHNGKPLQMRNDSHCYEDRRNKISTVGATSKATRKL